MDMQSTTMTTMSETVGSNNNNNINTNKRKRRSTVDEKDIENQRPPTKKSYSPSVVENYEEENIENTAVDFELYQALGSPQSVSIVSKVDQRASRTTNINNNNQNVVNSGVTGINASALNGGEITPQSQKHKELWNSCTNCANAAKHARLCPLPVLSFADAKEVWRFMCKKDDKAAKERDSQMLNNHPGIQPRMRAILLDWLIEVCEVYKLHRETYYLALDYLDRYLSTNISISKTYLQLIGITCLFIAAKVEEIYPPKLSEFAYVTDGACREEDILKQELIILNALKWQVNPVTIMGWLSVYMQLNVSKRMPKTISPMRTPDSTTLHPPARSSSKDGEERETVADGGFVFPQFSGLEFAQTAQLIDLCTLDLGIANYSYSVIAAAAISHTFNKKTAIKLSGLDWATISPCSKWMEPFFKICIQSPKLCLLENNEQVHSTYGLGHICPNIMTDDSHIIQMHSTNMDMFDEVIACIEQLQQEASPVPLNSLSEHTCPPHGLLTPPASNRKFIEGQPNSTCK